MRGRPAKPRKLAPDAKYNSPMVTKFINYVMLDGKKDKAVANVYEALEKLASNTKTDALAAFDQAIENVRPDVEVKARRVGGANLQVPTPVSPRRQLMLALRWIIDAARSARKDKPFSFYLAQELTSAFNNEGSAVKKKEDVERMAESNKAYSQFG